MEKMLSHNAEKFLNTVLQPLYQKLIANDYTTVYGTTKTVEIVNCHIAGLDPFNEFIDYPDVLEANREYIEREKNWYLLATKSVEAVKDVKVWANVANEQGEVNSNYGYRIFHTDNDCQYDKAIAALVADPSTRQSACIYTYPQIQTDWNKDGGHDMICTFCTQHFIRNGKLIYIVNMRSNDAILGFRNDFAWHCYVCKRMLEELQQTGLEVDDAEICWNAGSMHIYEARGGFDKLTRIVEKYGEITK